MIRALRLVLLLALCCVVVAPAPPVAAEVPEESAPAEAALPARDATPSLPAPPPSGPPAAPPTAVDTRASEGATRETARRQGKREKRKKKKKRKGRRKKKKRRRGSPLPALHARIGRTWMFLSPLRAAVGTGYLDGYGVLDQRGGFTRVALAATPTLRWRRGVFLLELPLAASYELPLGQELERGTLAAGLDVSGRLGAGFTARATGGVRVVAWPGRPDPYQPLLDELGEPTGALGATERYGYTRLDADVELAWSADPDGPELALEAGFDRRTYTRDPAFDPILTPTHLVPDDRDRWTVGATVRGKLDLWRYRFGVSYVGLDYAYAFARDAGTGLTHAGVGGAPANPLTHFDRLEVSHRSSFWVAPLRLRAALTVGYAHNVDTFAGYYSWDQLRLAPSLRLRPARGWVAELGYGFTWRGYADTGYQAGPDHPPLDDGATRRRSLGHQLEAALARDLSEALSLRLGVRWRRVDTSFPDYTPWAFPTGAPYAIDFDYSDLRAELRLTLAL